MFKNVSVRPVKVWVSELLCVHKNRMFDLPIFGVEISVNFSLLSCIIITWIDAQENKFYQLCGRAVWLLRLQVEKNKTYKEELEEQKRWKEEEKNKTENVQKSTKFTEKIWWNNGHTRTNRMRSMRNYWEWTFNLNFRSKVEMGTWVWNDDALLSDKFLNRKKRNPLKISEGYSQYYLLCL